MDDLLREFLTETAENLATLDVEIVRLEKNPEDLDLIGSVFRLVHTIKGTCGFLGLPRLEHLAHAGENILGRFRDRELKVTPQAVDLILRSLDRMKVLLIYLEKYQTECSEGNDDDLITALNAMAEDNSVPKAEIPVHPFSSAAADAFGFVPVLAGDMATLEANMRGSQNMRPPVEGTDVQAGTSVVEPSIRVNVDKLESLMTTISELVLTRNQLLQILRGQKESAFKLPLQRLNQVTSELQEGVMKARMQPVGNAWAKLPRIVRDLAHELHKKIDLQMMGAETELDRQVLELIKDPLTHMVRNSADHGIELPADRVRAGKPETGLITLSAFHERGHIIITITDDGRGLAVEKIRAKVLEKGLASASELAAMTEMQIMQFIFKAGFSTAAQVTSVSGRGVGMDVVKTNIERIGGTIDFKSAAGYGSSFAIKLPLTLAIVSALIVECAGERFAIPQICVTELVKASPDGEHHIELINETPFLRLRNRLLPLVALRKILKLGKEDIQIKDKAFILVIRVGNATLGVIVDRVFDMEEIVVKPLARILRHIDIFSGNTVLGDGSVIMILDFNKLVACLGQVDGEIPPSPTPVMVPRMSGEIQQSLLLFRAGGGAQKAVPLALVARLEEIDATTIEYSEGNPLVQYRGKLMPLIALETVREFLKPGRQVVVVFTDNDKYIGLMVDEILDIVEERLHVDLSGRRQGMLGTAIVAGKATDIMDAAYYVSQAFPGSFGKQDHAFDSSVLRRVLLVDDSPFFRNLLTPLLTVAGYDVTAVENPAEAFKLQEEGVSFDAIVSDIEMPGMNGFDFVSALRKSKGKWSRLPILAMSSHATKRDIERGRQVGFSDYVAKFNREGLLHALNETLKQEGAPHE